LRDACYDAAAANVADAYNKAALGAVMSVAAVLAALAIVIAVLILVNRRVTKPLTELTDVIGRIADGKRDLEINYRERADETGTLAKAIGVLQDKSSEADRLSREQTQAEEHREARRRDFSELMDGVCRGLAEAAGGMKQSAESLNLSAETTSSRAGFAVVASEVKSLATQTARATEEIESQIGAIQEETGATVVAIEKIASVVNDISSVSGSIAAAVEEQSAATQEIARNVQQTASRTDEVSSSITMVSNTALDTQNSAGSLLKAAATLANQAVDLRREFEAFVANVKAA
jgi:methyl-accepting chemotaxis protein